MKYFIISHKCPCTQIVFSSFSYLQRSQKKSSAVRGSSGQPDEFSLDLLSQRGIKSQLTELRPGIW